MSDAAQAEKTVPNRNTGRILKNGGRSGNGRPKGRKNLSTIVREHAGGKDTLTQLEDGIPALDLKPFVFRMAALLKHKNGFIRATTEKFLYEALHGKPKQQTDVNLNVKDPHDALRRASAAASAIRAAGTIEATLIDARLLDAPQGNGSNGNGHHE